MRDYSIENSAEKINSKETKNYFEEVKSSYFNGNYRASIVTLYSVVITDILIKLETLKEVYNDETAEKILREVETFQSEKPTSAEWEKDIIKKVMERTDLIDNIDFARVSSLQKDRHLCAHPVIDKDNKLHTPNPETVASHIRNMLESFFLKPPMLSKKILTTILIDISERTDIFITKEDLVRYLTAKYFTKLNPTVEISLFRDLSKLVFFLDNDEANKNRQINYSLLDILFKRNISSCKERIKNEVDYFSKINEKEEILGNFVAFLGANDFPIKAFGDDLSLIVERKVEKSFSIYLEAYFLSDSISTHFQKIKKNVQENSIYHIFEDFNNVKAFGNIIDIGFTKGYINETIEFITWKYSTSCSFNDASRCYNLILSSEIHRFNETQFNILLSGMNKNDQIYNRHGAYQEHSNIKKYIQQNINASFNFEKYPNIF